MRRSVRCSFRHSWRRDNNQAGTGTGTAGCRALYFGGFFFVWFGLALDRQGHAKEVTAQKVLEALPVSDGSYVAGRWAAHQLAKFVKFPAQLVSGLRTPFWKSDGFYSFMPKNCVEPPGYVTDDLTTVTTVGATAGC